MERTTTITKSGRASITMGARHLFGLTIRPEQMLEFFHDVIPSAPIPFDANFEMLGFDDSTRTIEFYFTSKLVRPACYQMTVEEFFLTLKRHGEGIIPSDAELDGIEVSDKFTVIMLRVRSDHFPPHPGDKLPIAHIRYEAGELALVNPAEAIFKDRRIRIK